MEELARVPSYLSRELKALVCFTPERKRGFDATMTYLQMQAYVNIADFEYARDKFGKEYGWGLARYTTPEAFFGKDFKRRVYAREPEESREILAEYLAKKFPHITKNQVKGLLG